ncbi:MAG: ScpA family protein [Mariprofundus sp.]
MTQTAPADLLVGEAIKQTAMPTLHLDQFEGPLDLLLHLIRRQQMDIFDIPIATLTRQYLDLLELPSSTDDQADSLDLDIAGDYLVMASTLMQLKSRMLLPRSQLDDEGNSEDPRAELTAQLIAYEQYRLLAAELNDLPRLGRDVFSRSVFPEAANVHRPLPEGNLDALLLAFRHVLKRVGGDRHHQIPADTMSVREQMRMVLDQLGTGGMQLDTLLWGTPGREALVTTMMAILELWRQQRIGVVQSECYGPVTLLPGQPGH